MLSPSSALTSGPIKGLGEHGLGEDALGDTKFETLGNGDAGRGDAGLDGKTCEVREDFSSATDACKLFITSGNSTYTQYLYV